MRINPIRSFAFFSIAIVLIGLSLADNSFAASVKKGRKASALVAPDPSTLSVVQAPPTTATTTTSSGVPAICQITNGVVVNSPCVFPSAASAPAAAAPAAAAPPSAPPSMPGGGGGGPQQGSNPQNGNSNSGGGNSGSSNSGSNNSGNSSPAPSTDSSPKGSEAAKNAGGNGACADPVPDKVKKQFQECMKDSKGNDTAPALLVDPAGKAWLINSKSGVDKCISMGSDQAARGLYKIDETTANKTEAVTLEPSPKNSNDPTALVRGDGAFGKAAGGVTVKDGGRFTDIVKELKNGNVFIYTPDSKDAKKDGAKSSEQSPCGGKKQDDQKSNKTNSNGINI